jgi:1-acyl-sn-glycerol-3-phosphate acyltransferase
VLAIVFGRIHALTQVEAFTVPFFGRLLAHAGQIPVASGRGPEALARAAEQLALGESVLIYPEGRLSHGGQLLQARTGAARLSLSTGAPLLPIAFYVPPGYGRVFHGRHFDRPTVGVWQIGGPCSIVIGEPWSPFAGRESASEEEIRAAADGSLARVQAMLEEARWM